MAECSIRRFNAQESTFATTFDAFMRGRSEQSGDAIAANVKDIINDVKQRGDNALFDYTQRFDNLPLDAHSIRISDAEIAQAHEECPQHIKDALSFAARRITDYHQHQLPKDWSYKDTFGNTLGMRWSAVDSAGIYVPGGKASYPSSVLMNALPARAAGVERIAMTVPTPNGDMNPAILVAASLCKVDAIYRVGGAQAIAALAYGTQSIPRVNVIAGPGNAYVAEAKRQVFGTVGIDMIAGPSEIAIIADGNTPPEWLAADMLSQAEHDEMAQSILITSDADYADKVEQAIKHILTTLPRCEIATASLNAYGAIIVTDSLEQACDVANIVAAEHLELAVEDTDYCLKRIRHAGAIFIGNHTPEAIGDYVAGPSHVLPTTQSAAYASGLSVYHFMKKTSLIGCTEDGFTALADATAALAECEGLHAHALSVTTRQ